MTACRPSLRCLGRLRSAQPLTGFLYALAGLLGLIGFIFIAGFKGMIARLIIGLVLVAAALALGWLTKAKAPERTIVQKIDLSGDVSAEQLKCKQCGAPVDDKSIEMREGAMFVKCPYCGTSYQLEEAPKW
jgi:hypothetical protein